MRRIIYVVVGYMLVSLGTISFGYDAGANIQTNESVSDVKCESNYSLALSDNNNLYEWGRIGGENITIPRKILENVEKIIESKTSDAGVITKNNELYLWRSSIGGLVPLESINKPYKVEDGIKDAYINGVLVRTIDGIAVHPNVYRVKQNGELYVKKYVPEAGWRDIKVMDNIKEMVSGGASFQCAITNDNELYIWDNNVYLESINDNLYTLNELSALSKEEAFIVNGQRTAEVGPIKLFDNVKSVASTSGGLIILTYDADVYVWGDCISLAGGKYGEFLSNVPKKYLTGIRAVATDGDEYYFVKLNGDLIKTKFLKWENKKEAVFSKLVKINSNVRSMDLTLFGQRLVVLENGEVISTGFNESGELGLGYVSNGLWNDEYAKVKRFKARKKPAKKQILFTKTNLHINQKKYENIEMFSYEGTAYIAARGLVQNNITTVTRKKIGDYNVTDLKSGQSFIFDKFEIIELDGRIYLPIRKFANIFKYNLEIQGSNVYLSPLLLDI